MRIGLIYDFANPPRWRRDPVESMAHQLERIAWAEQLGIDSVWLPEHHFSADGHAPSPIPMMAAIATRTSRVSIGTSVLLAPLYHPVRLAEDLALVDLLSGGRVEVGLGLGWAADEYDAFGVDPRQRVSRTQELVDILRQAWTEDELHYDGRHFSVGPVAVTPKPARQPHPPIWGGANSAEAGHRTGRWGLPLLAVDPPVVASYQEGLQAAGHPTGVGRLGGFLWGLVADDPDRAWAETKEQLVAQRSRFSRPKYEPGGRIVIPPSPDPAALAASVRGAIMTPDEAIREIRRLQAELAVPIDNVHYFGAVPGGPDEINDRHVELVATVVGPAVKRQRDD